MVKVQTYSSVWDAIADSPEEACNLKLRSELMDALEAYILREGITQQVAAERLGIPRSRVSELVNGRISKFTIDKLVNMAARVGLAVTVAIEEARHRWPTHDAQTQRILGIDFTSRPTSSKPITVADCHLSGDRLSVQSLRKLRSFEEFERLLAADGPWVAAIDMPFAQPDALIEALGWPKVWRDCIRYVADLGKDAFEQALNDYRQAQPYGRKEHLRRTDKLAKSLSPMKLHFQPVGKMFFQGAPRLLRSEANIVPCAPNGVDRTVVEAYPALVAHYLANTRSYKHDKSAKPIHEDARRKIVEALASETCRKQYGVSVSLDPKDRRELVNDPKADLLDAVLCAVQGAWASRQQGFGVPPDCDDEGWIVDPALASPTREG